MTPASYSIRALNMRHSSLTPTKRQTHSMRKKSMMRNMNMKMTNLLSPIKMP